MPRKAHLSSDSSSGSENSADIKSLASTSVITSDEIKHNLPRHAIQIKSFVEIAPTFFLKASHFTPFKALPEGTRLIHLQAPNHLQAAITENGISFHVQFELERRVGTMNNLSMSDFYPEDYLPLCSTIENAMPQIDTVINRALKHKLERDNIETGELNIIHETNCDPVSLEAHKEEFLIRRDTAHDTMDHYGGKIVYALQINFDNTFGDFRVELLPPELSGRSCQITRLLGSRRLLLMRYSERTEQKFLFQLCVGRLFILFGRPYRALFRPVDSHSIYLVETDDVVAGVTFCDPLDPPAKPFLETLGIFNSHENRQKEAMVKFAARLQLPFSSTRPGKLLDRDSVAVIQDELSHKSTQQNLEAHHVLTDGCGFISRQCCDNPHLTLLDGQPRAIQIRINGCKGLVTLMSEQQEKEFRGKAVVLRRSMVKAWPSSEYANHPTNLTLNVVRYGVVRFGISLFSDASLALVHCGVPQETLTRLFTASPDRLQWLFTPEALPGETEDDTLIRLCDMCFGRGGVKAFRDARLRIAKGKGPCDDGGEYDRKGKREFNQCFIDQMLVGTGFKDINVKPFTAAEQLMECTAAGISPHQSLFTTLAIHDLMKELTESPLSRLKVFVPKSLVAFATPDHTGLLKPGEVQINFSTTAQSEFEKKFHMSELSGDCVILRSPCILHNDARKYRIVDHPELKHRVDEVIFCANSDLLSESSMIHHSFGDYDGDTVFVIFDHELVEPFNNEPDSSYLPPENFKRDNFEVAKLRGREFVNALDKAEADEETRILNYQYFLLHSLSRDNPVGLYYHMHDNAVYELGYKHPETIRLAHMFNTTLDSPKTGLAVRGRVRREDFQKYSKYAVGWRCTENPDYKPYRPEHLGPFIMDQLREIADRKREEIAKVFPASLPSTPTVIFDTLSPLYLKERENADRARRERVKELEDHVRSCLDLWTLSDSCRIPPNTEMRNLYRDIGEIERLLQFSPWSQNVNPASNKAWSESEIRRIKNLQAAHLARTFQSYPSAEQMKMKEEALGKLRISCAANLAEKDKRDFAVLNLDFHTALEMVAEANGREMQWDRETGE